MIQKVEPKSMVFKNFIAKVANNLTSLHRNTAAERLYAHREIENEEIRSMAGILQEGIQS